MRCFIVPTAHSRGQHAVSAARRRPNGGCQRRTHCLGSPFVLSRAAIEDRPCDMVVADATIPFERASRSLLFLVTEDWYFWGHRLALARAARDAGYAVTVATRVGAFGDRIRTEGFTLIPLAWKRGSLNPLRLVAETVAIARL